MEDRLNDERRRKQNYLSNEILEQNFDSNDFQSFLESKKDNGGTDIDVWTYEQLVDLVREYKLLKRQVQTQSNFNRTFSKQSSFQNQDIGTPKSLVTSQIVDVPQMNDKFDFTQEDYSNMVNCKPLHKSNINENDQIDIAIDSFEVKQGGLISSSYAIFKISTKPYGFEVKRRFSEFLAFRNGLIKMFPAIAVPPIPAKAVGRTLETGYLNKRRIFFQRFLRDLVQIPELKCCRLFFEFISVDESTLKTKIKEWENYNRPEQVENFTSLNGQLVLNINSDIRNYIGKANDLVISSESLYQRLGKLNKQLTKDYDQLSLTLYNISEVFMGLYNVNSTFNSSVNLGKKTVLDDLYLTYNNLMVDLGNIMVNQVKVVQEDIKSFFKYEKNCNECVKDLIKERNSCYQEYDKARHKEQKRQIELQTGNKKGFSSIFTKDDTKKIERNLANSRDKFGYFNQKVNDEIDRCLKLKGIKFIGNFGVFIENEFRLVSDMQEVWTFYRTEIEKLIEGQRSSLIVKKVDVKKVISVKKGDAPFENKLPNK